MSKDRKEFYARSLVRPTTEGLPGEVTPSWYTDYATALANRYGLYVRIKGLHIPDEKVGAGGVNEVKFRAFLNSYNESYTTKLKAEQLVGHYEPLRKVTGIERTLQIGVDIPSFSIEDAMANLQEVNNFIQLLYPRTKSTTAGGIKQKYVRTGGDPIFRVKFANFVIDSTPKTYEEGKLTNAHPITTLGQKGYIDNVNYQFQTNQGFYVLPNGFSYPKLITLSFSFYPLHEVSPSWAEQGFDHHHIPNATQPDVLKQFNISQEGRAGAPISISPAGNSLDSPPPVRDAEGKQILGQNRIEQK